MNVFSFLFAIVVVALTAKTLRSYFAHRAQLRTLEINRQKMAESNSEYQKELDLLRERVEMLEKVVVSKGYTVD